MSLAYIAQGNDHQELEWIEGGRMSILLDGNATEGQVTVVRSQLRAGAASPLHRHQNEDEMFVLFKGNGVFWVGEERHEVSEGGSVFLPRHLAHAYRFVTDSDLLTICTPSGIEGFFRGAGRDLKDPRPDGFEITMQALAAAAVAGGQEILGPPPS